MFPNGYVMVDATGVDESAASAKTIAGLHAKLDGAFKSGKPAILAGVVDGTTVYSPISTILYQSSTSYVAALATKTLTVTINDSATVE